MNESSNCFASFLVLSIVRFLSFQLVCSDISFLFACSLVPNDVEHLFMFIFFNEMSLQIFYPFFELSYLLSFLMSFECSLYILDTSSVSEYAFQTFSPILIKEKSPVLSSRNVIFLDFTFMLHFELIFHMVQGVG